MSTLRNTVQLIGNVGKKPEIRTSTNGKKYALVSLATTEKYTNKAGEKIADTTWHNLLFWENQAELAEKYIDKGSFIGIQGKLVTRQLADKDGTMRSNYEIRVLEISLLGGKNNANGESSQPTTASTSSTTTVAVDDLPF